MSAHGHQLTQLASTIGDVPPGTAEHRALVMLLDLNQRMHEDLISVQEELRALKGSPRVQQTGHLESLFLDKLRNKAAAGEVGTFIMGYHKESFHKCSAGPVRYGAVQAFSISMDKIRINGNWDMSFNGPVPFTVPGQYDNKDVCTKEKVHWHSVEELGELAARKLINGANNWRLSYILCDDEQLYVANDVP